VKAGTYFHWLPRSSARLRAAVFGRKDHHACALLEQLVMPALPRGSLDGLRLINNKAT
jgi:hypothetical protein